MTPLYVFCAAVGVPLLLWFAFVGDADGLGDGGVDAGDGGEGPLSIIPLSTPAFVVAFFGVTGLVAGWIGVSAGAALVAAVVVGLVAGGLNSAAFAWLRRNSVSTDLAPAEIEGRFARVTVPVSRSRRGRIVVELAGQPRTFTARAADDDGLEAGERVIVVGFDGPVALVVRAAPELR